MSKSIEELAKDLQQAKQTEAEAKHQRELVEAQIYRLVQSTQTIPERGTVTAGPIKISTTMAESWDQDALDDLSKVIPPEHFPFKPEWKKDGRAMTKLAADHPDQYRKLFPALTVKPRKPSFRVVEEKEK